jgi:hypothetical protein
MATSLAIHRATVRDAAKRLNDELTILAVGLTKDKMTVADLPEMRKAAARCASITNDLLKISPETM